MSSPTSSGQQQDHERDIVSPTSKKPSMLVIDDDADIRAIVTVLFEHHGWEVNACADGIDALQLTRHYDVILLDLNMPIFDGERLADYWALTDPGILRRVIILSGYSRFTRGRTLDTFAVLQKPFDLDRLLSIALQCLDASASGRVSG